MKKTNYSYQKLNKSFIQWLRIYGYILNKDDEVYRKVRKKLKEEYPYEYYFYVDLNIKKEAEDYAKKYHCVYENRKQYYKTINKIFKYKKKQLIKELYGIKK